MIYVIVFVIEIFILFLVSKIEKNKIIPYILAAFPLIVLATLRGDTVGIDVLVYVKSFFMMGTRSPDFVSYYNSIDTEVGYLVLNYLVSRFTDKFIWLHFFNAILVTVPVFIVMAYVDDTIPAATIGLTYLCFFYNYNTMSQIRQGIAMSMLLLGTIMLFKGKKKGSIVLFFLSVLFHVTSLFGISVVTCLFYLIDTDDKKQKGNKKIMLGLIFVSTFVVSIYYKDILNVILGKLPIYYSIKYSNYMHIDQSNIHNAIGISYLITKLLCILISFGLYRFNVNKKLNVFLFSMQMIAILLVPAATKIDFGYRLLRYTDIFEILILPQSKYLISNKKNNWLIVDLIVSVYVISYWIVNTLINNQGGTLPYKIGV